MTCFTFGYLQIVYHLGKDSTKLGFTLASKVLKKTVISHFLSEIWEIKANYSRMD